MKTKRGAAGNLLCSHHGSRRQALALANIRYLSLPVHSAPHNPDIIAISCVPIARAAPLILADAQGYFADHPATPTATAATMTASLQGNEHTFGT